MGNQPVVPIGNGRGFKTTSAIAFDAGYTTGVRGKATMASLGLPDTPENSRKLNAIAESCLDGGSKLAPALPACYTAGIALAAMRHSTTGR